jgi:hypothetical protein
VARSTGYLERLIAGAEGRSAVRAPYRRAWGPSAVPMLERPEAPTPDQPSRRSSARRDRPASEPVPATPSRARPGPPPIERPPAPSAAAEPPTPPPPASAATRQAAAEPPSPGTEPVRALPVTASRPRAAEHAARRSKPAPRPVPQPPSLAPERAVTSVQAAAPAPRRASTHASTPRQERLSDPVRDAIPASATYVLRPPRRPPVAQREPQVQARPLVQIGTVDVHVAAPPAPPAPPPPVPVATIPSAPLSRPAPVFGLAQG